MKNVRTLLVDDNERFLASIERYLASIPEPHIDCVARAGSGEEAIRLSGSLKPDLILMDVTLPGINGLDALQSIKRAPNAPRIIILTIHEGDEYRWAAREAGADGFLTKSDFSEKLIRLVQSIFPVSSESSDSSSSEGEAQVSLGM
jgi:DNA-binding NarL/FixJ family response regulator